MEAAQTINKIKLEGMVSSWENFFEVIREREDPIRRRDGKSLGNFWAFLQHLEQQYLEKVN